ncbi:YslB family protein [Radiobacillus sp. PE A8.2]|uniref:YslB family protein n=1 Tax=Radiobacillus sp. PE A8.2 TaxID=3380349 RepID=UPI00388EE4A4
MSPNEKPIQLNQLQTTGAGHDLLRYVCLPDLLGKDAKNILYVMGKNLARTYHLDSLESVVDFFAQMGWGTLELKKEKRNELVFELTGQPIAQREEAKLPVEYRLEAGFLAQAIQQINETACECLDERKGKKQMVVFQVINSM